MERHKISVCVAPRPSQRVLRYERSCLWQEVSTHCKQAILFLGKGSQSLGGGSVVLCATAFSFGQAPVGRDIVHQTEQTREYGYRNSGICL